MEKSFAEGLIKKVIYQKNGILLTINECDFILPLTATTDERLQIAMACEHNDKIYYSLSARGDIEQILLPIYSFPKNY